MIINIITLFPELFSPFLEWSMIKKAIKIGAIKINIYNLRQWAIDKRGTVDDKPYGGGVGMILRIEPIYNALNSLGLNPQKSNINLKSKIILLSPKGKTFDQKMARKLAKYDQLTLICGHYEGIDERVKKLVDKEISIGNYILSGGELPAMVITDVLSRLQPKVLEKEGASQIESFSPGLKKMLKKHLQIKDYSQSNLIEFPQYTRPPEFKGLKVPKILLSGNHQKIARWRAQKITRQP